MGQPSPQGRSCPVCFKSGPACKCGESRKAYLGDGAYYECDGEGITITAENGIEVLSRVYLGPEEMGALLREMAKDFAVSRMVEILEKAKVPGGTW